MQITVSQLPALIHEGDWHDRPLKWVATGPGDEHQNFSTKKDAMRFATLRRRSASFSEASRKFVLEA